MYLSTFPHKQDVTQGQFLSGVLQVWIEFSFKTNCHTKVKETSLPYNLPLAGGRLVVIY